MKKVLQLQYLRKHERSIIVYTNICHILVDETIRWAKKKYFYDKSFSPKALYISKPGGWSFAPMVCVPEIPNVNWFFHAVIELNGDIHDAWFPEVVPQEEYMARNFGHCGRMVLSDKRPC